MSTTAAPAEPDINAAPPSAARTDRRAILLHCLFFAVLAYCAHFWYSGRFGVYEDDIVVIPGAAAWSWHELWHWIWDRTVTFEHGRPVSYATWILLPRLGFLLGNLHTVYIVCSLVVVANSVLFYLLLRRCYGQSVALLGAITFVLFPADTTRALLVHTNILQPAVLFFLVGAHCYLSKRYVLAYGMGFAILLSYESPFLPFLFLPLLRPRALDGRAAKRVLLHGAICAALVLITVGIRLAVGEDRVVEASSSARVVAYRILTNAYLGPATALKLLATDAFVPLARLAIPGILAAMILGLIACAVLLLASPLRRRQTGADRPPHPFTWYPLLLGLAMFCTAYTFAISPAHYPPTAEYGRMTSVHLAATIGGSLALASALQLLLRLADRAASAHRRSS